MFYFKGKNRDHLVHFLPEEGGQDHAKNTLKEWRSLSLETLGPTCTAGCQEWGPGWQLRRIHPRQGRAGPCAEKEEQLGTLENNAFGRNTQNGLYNWECPSTGSRCHVAGQDGEETAASQWPLVRCIYNRARC